MYSYSMFVFIRYITHLYTNTILSDPHLKKNKKIYKLSKQVTRKVSCIKDMLLSHVLTFTLYFMHVIPIRQLETDKPNHPF